MKTIDVSEIIPKKWILRCYVQCTDTEYNSIFDEEKVLAGLVDKTIFLLVPETPEDIDYSRYGTSCKAGDSYNIRLNPIPERRARENHTIRETLRHEFAHIKYGDCDRKLPSILEKIYHSLIKEPRATLYEKNSIFLFLFEPIW